jgi:hypothetical protein
MRIAPLARVIALVPVLFLGCGGGQKAATTTDPAVKPTPVGAEKTAPAGTPLLWEAKGPEGSIWLYGTIHTGGADLVPKAAWDALGQAETFVMELDLATLDQATVLKRAMLPAGQTLDTMISKEAWQKLVAALAPIGMTEDVLKRFKPWFAAMAVLQTLMPGGEATDQALLRQAKDKGLVLEYLETADEQLGAAEKALDAKALESLVVDLDGARQGMTELVDAYKRGDVDAIIKLTTDPSQMTPEAAEVMLYQRNRNWLPKLETYLKKGKVFVAVGAGHLPGPGGVLELLEKKGYTITRVAP